MIPSTEAILTSAAGFNLDTATPVQRARCRIRDGVRLGELRDDADVEAMLGGAEALAALPSERGIAPDMVVDASSVRSAKTLMACAAAARATQAVTLQGLKRGEVPRIPLFSLKLDRARVAFRMLSALFTESAALHPLVLDATADSLLVRHPSGRPVEVVCTAGGRAASGFVGDWLAGIIADEAPRMIGRDDGVTNLDDVLTAVRGRMLPGAQIQLIGSPWAPSGPVYELVQEHFGKPSEHVVVMRSTGPMNNPAHFTPEFCEKLQIVDPVAFQTDVKAAFADPESGLLSPFTLKRQTREAPERLEYTRERSYVAAIDPSEGTAKGNAWTLIVLEVRFVRRDDEDGTRRRVALARVAVAQEFRGLSPAAALREIASICSTYRLDAAMTDQYAGSALADLAKRFGLRLRVIPTTAPSKLEMFTTLATMLDTERLELAPAKQLRADLLSVKKRATQSGYTIVLPRTADGRHCDFAPALALAAQYANKTRGPGELSTIGYARSPRAGW